MPYNPIVGNFMTRTFADIFPSAAEFYSEYLTNEIDNSLTQPKINRIYYLLYARYGNSCICNLDENQFKYKVYAIIFQYGLAWDRKLEIQQTLRGLSEADLMAGTKTILNHANHPDTTPSAAQLDELTYIDEQNISNIKRGKLEAYNALWGLLEDDVTKSFLDKFKELFLRITYPQAPLWYASNQPEEEDEDESE